MYLLRPTRNLSFLHLCSWHALLEQNSKTICVHTAHVPLWYALLFCSPHISLHRIRRLIAVHM